MNSVAPLPSVAKLSDVAPVDVATAPHHAGVAALHRIATAQQEIVALSLNGAGLDGLVDKLLAMMCDHFGATLGIAFVRQTSSPDNVVLDTRRATAECPPSLVNTVVDTVLPLATHGADACTAVGAQLVPVLADHAVHDHWLQPITLAAPSCTAGIVLGFAAARAQDETERLSLAAYTALLSSIIGNMAREGSLRSASDGFESLASTIPGVVYQRLVKPDGDIRYTYISESAYELFGVPAEEILANPRALFDSYGKEYRETFRERLLEASRNLTTWDVEANIVMPDGRQKFTHAMARPQRLEDGSVLWTGVILDATRIKEAEFAASAAEARTREAIVESLGQGLLLFDPQDRLSLTNSHFFALYPALRATISLGMNYDDVIATELSQGLDAPPEGSSALKASIAERLAVHRANEHNVIERQLTDDCWILINEHRTAEGGTVILYTDVSDLKQREARIQHMAHHDALTGLPNRVLFRERISRALASAKRRNSAVGVMCLDLDHFKHVNDTLGHPAGDALLRTVAERISAEVRETDTVARLGGDEFAIVLTDLADPATNASSMATRLLQAGAQPVDIAGQQVITGFSIGIAVSISNDEQPDDLLKNADLALYRAKADGRGTLRFFEAEMDALAHARRTLEIDLRRAIEQELLMVYYQPLYDARNENLVGFEALVRWQHHERGFISPGEFIPLAEETGLIVQLGYWVMRRACSEAASWPEDVKVAVNLSPAQFKRRDLPQMIGRIIEETGIQPKRLELEVTESVLLNNTEETLAMLYSIKQLGVRIAMDDFGTGYSSLGNLRSFPFDKIKIDRSFVSDLEKNTDAAAIVRAVLGLGRSLGVETTAEGVETKDQLAYLRIEGCTEVQGFYYSQAKPAAEIGHMFRKS